MAISGPNRKPARILMSLVAVIIGLIALLGSVSTWGEAQRTPLLGLDLEGGTQVVLEPVLTGSASVSEEQLDQARGIIVQRIDANGVSGAEVTTLGGQNIVVSVPGALSRTNEEAIRRSSQLQFRPVICAQQIAVPIPDVTGTESGTPTGPGTATGAPSGPATAPPAATATGSPSTQNGAIPQAFTAATTPAPSATATDAPTGTATTDPGAGAADPTCPPGAEGAAPTDESDPNWVNAEISTQYAALTCQEGDTFAGTDDATKPLVTCGDGSKYVLGPVVTGGSAINDASAGYQTSQNGQPTNVVEIQLSFDSEGAKAYGDASSRMVALPDPRNRMAATLDSQVIVAPFFQSAIPNGEASITGQFTIEGARALADQLKFGALPLSFELQTRSEISPTLGGEQLRFGIIAGIIGAALVILYSLFQYRALGLVTVASLLIAGSLTYLALTLLGWSQNFRLDMAGVTGLIVSIGVTADSFIVYFERIRDEVREGRPLRSAVDTGWARARRTILAADGVNFLAAVILYALASSNVRGFAFTLLLTTLIDLLVVVMFTHPIVAILSGTKFFGGGHRLSGLDPVRLGAKVPLYRGRGRVRTTPAAATRTATRPGRPATDGSAS